MVILVDGYRLLTEYPYLRVVWRRGKSWYLVFWTQTKQPVVTLTGYFQNKSPIICNVECNMLAPGQSNKDLSSHDASQAVVLQISGVYGLILNIQSINCAWRLFSAYINNMEHVWQWSKSCLLVSKGMNKQVYFKDSTGGGGALNTLRRSFHFTRHKSRRNSPSSN